MLKSVRRTAQRGMSLVELMVGLTVGMMVVAAAGALYITNHIAGRDALNAARLNAIARGAMDTMVDDIRRAGSATLTGNWFDIQTGEARTRNPFQLWNTNSGAVDISDLNTYDSGNCFVYSFDRNGNGVLDDGSGTEPSEYFGYRLNGTKLQMRSGGADNLSNCTNGNWSDLTDPTALTVTPPSGTVLFSVSYHCMNATTNAVGAEGSTASNRCLPGNTIYNAAVSAATTSDLLETRRVTIAFQATLVDQPDMTLLQQQDVLVRNHRIVNIPKTP